MTIDTALVLCGGPGTRLHPVLPDRPKALAEIAGRPFLDRLLEHIAGWGIRRVVLGTGYMAGQIVEAIGPRRFGLDIAYSEENTPLGTGGAIRHALPHLTGASALVLNGDSFCGVDQAALLAAHARAKRRLTLTLVTVDDVGRYGAATIDRHGRIDGFSEKGESRGEGLINAGIYVMDLSLVREIPADIQLSLEEDLFPRWIAEGVNGYVADGPFIDIGTPESLVAAQTFFSRTAG